MAVLVIGGCGFIGKHIVAALSSSGVNSVVFDRIGDPGNNSEFCTYLSGDIGDLALPVPHNFPLDTARSIP